MRILRDPDHLLVRLDRGEDVPASLCRLARAEGLAHASVSAIGAVEAVEIGAYDLERREYLRRSLDGGWEVLSLGGNLGWSDGEPILHAHVVLGGMDCEVVGGHLFAARVHVTLEVVVRPGRTRLERALDPATGLKLWRIPDSDPPR